METTTFPIQLIMHRIYDIDRISLRVAMGEFGKFDERWIEMKKIVRIEG